MLKQVIVLSAISTIANSSAQEFGKLEEATNRKTSASDMPLIEVADPWATELTANGKTNKPMDSTSLAAKLYEVDKAQKEAKKRRLKNLDKSIRLDMISGQQESILITTENFVQITLLKEGEVVSPTNIIVGNEQFLTVKTNAEKSPYIYLTANVMLENQVTNVFIETNEDGKIQTYPLKLVITKPENVTDQIILNLTSDNTPNIRGAAGSKASQKEREQLLAQQINNNAVANGNFNDATWSFTGQSAKAGAPGTGHNTRKFSRDDVRSYFGTMIEMAKAYHSAKTLERIEGKVIYSPDQIQPGAVAPATRMDPVAKDIWTTRPWFFPKYDAIVLECNQYNPSNKPSGWNFALTKWDVGSTGYLTLDPTAVKPEAPAALPKKSNRIWVLLQGNNISVNNEFLPRFPVAKKRR